MRREEYAQRFGPTTGDLIRLADTGLWVRVGRDDVLLLFNASETILGGKLPSHGACGPGHFALGIPADSREDWRARLSRFCVAIEQEVEWPKGGKSFYFRDPSNNSVELITPGIWGLPSGW